jgi:hypothetical protein
MYVYLDQNANKLVISGIRITSPGYSLLMNNSGGSYVQVLGLCKIFCIGYIMGAQGGKVPSNDINEFE